MPVGAKLTIPVPSHPLIMLFNTVRFRASKSWFTAIPFDEFVISLIVLLLIVIVPLVVIVGLFMEIAFSLQLVMMLLVATTVKLSTGVARYRPALPLFDIVFVDAVTLRVVILPSDGI